MYKLDLALNNPQELLGFKPHQSFMSCSTILSPPSFGLPSISPPLALLFTPSSTCCDILSPLPLALLFTPSTTFCAIPSFQGVSLWRNG